MLTERRDEYDAISDGAYWSGCGNSIHGICSTDWYTLRGADIATLISACVAGGDLPQRFSHWRRNRFHGSGAAHARGAGDHQDAVQRHHPRELVEAGQRPSHGRRLELGNGRYAGRILPTEQHTNRRPLPRMARPDGPVVLRGGKWSARHAREGPGTPPAAHH